MASVIDPAKVEAIRNESIIETEGISRKARFGLFNQPPPNAVHDGYDDTPYNHRVGNSQAPEGSQRNVSIAKMKKGKNDDVLFSAPGYNTIGDTYQDPHKLKKYGYHNGTGMTPQQYMAWKDNDKNKTKIKAPYPYMSEVYEDEKGIASRAKRGIKQADKVKADKEAFKSGKRKDKYVNYIKSKPMGLFSSYGHFAEPYSNQEDIERVERADHKAKIKRGPFGVKTNIHRPFQANRHIYDDNNFANKNKKKRGGSLAPLDKNLSGTRFAKTKSGSKEPWRPNNPSKKGYNKTLNKLKYYHTGLYYKEKMIDKTHEEKIWIPNSNGTFAKPCPASNKFVRNRRFMLQAKRGLKLPYATRKV